MVERLGVQPWGYPPTPLIPKALLDDLGHLSVPASLRKHLANRRTLKQLHSEIWAGVRTVDSSVMNELVRFIHPKLRSLKHIELRNGEPLPIPLQELPFSTRIKNAIVAHGNVFSSEHLTIGDLLRVPGLGAKSITEFACVLEAALSSERDKVVRRTQITPPRIKSFFQLLGAYAAAERELKCIAAVLPDANDDWPAEIKHLWKEIGHLTTSELAGSFVQRYSAAALLERWLESVDERLRQILLRRTFRINRPDTLLELGRDLNVTRERVRQLEKKATCHLEKLSHAEFAPIIRAAERLRLSLGSAIPEANWHARISVSHIFPGFDSLTREVCEITSGLLVHLAGPYKATGGWVVSDTNLVSKTEKELKAHMDERGCVPKHVLVASLAALGIRTEFHERWIDELRDFKSVEDGYIHLKGSIAEKAKALLRYHGVPLTVEDMIGDLGSDSVRSVRQRLMDDAQIWRINRQNQFVLANTPGYDEYTGITDEIVQEIEACGGKASIHHLVSKLASVYGVQEASVYSYLNTPMFKRDAAGLVRLRREDEPVDLHLDITKAPGCYVNARGNWCWRIIVEPSLIRGSGRMMPNAMADLFGCGVGDRLEIDSDHGPIAITWPSSSATGAAIGSMRQALSDIGAQTGDNVFVEKNGDRVAFTRLSIAELDASPSGLVRLLRLLGREPASGKAEIAKHLSEALKVGGRNDEERLSACRLKLQSRGEDNLAELIDDPKRSVDGYLSSMEELFKQ